MIARQQPSQSGRRYNSTQTYRLSVEDKARLVREAEELGLTLQQLHELRMLGAARPIGRAGRPPHPRQAQELPIAG